MRFRLLLALLLLAPSIFVARPALAQTPELVIYEVPSAGSLDESSIRRIADPALDLVLSELNSLFDSTLLAPVTMIFDVAPHATIQAQWDSVSGVAWMSTQARIARIDIDRFALLTPLEQTNVLRNLVARQVLFDATNGALASGLLDGIATYIERPILAIQARRGSLVQQTELTGQLPAFADIVNGTTPLLNSETSTALHYALVAFVADHYGISAVRELVSLSDPSRTWQQTLTGATSQSAQQLEEAWKQFLPRWYAGGWQYNALNGFDTTAAQELFERGAYANSITLAEASLELFTELDDRVKVAEIEAFIARSAIGVRAEQLMKETQAALELYDYELAAAKLAEAESQYAYLPDSHKPQSLIDQWSTIIATGLKAETDLIKAQAAENDWSRTREARDLATTAGNGFASIGDTANALQSESLVDQMNTRLQRITLATIAVVLIVAMWLLMWLWSMAPTRFRWQDAPAHAGVR